MVERSRQKMPVAQRAKQFMPFAALKGFEEAIAAKEVPFQERRIPSEEMAYDINETLLQLQANDIISVTFYRSGRYISLTGPLQQISLEQRLLFIDGIKVCFNDIIDITV